MADVEDVSIGRSLSAASRQSSVGVGEFDLVEVREGDQGEAFLEVLDDPLGVLLAQVALSRSERVGHALASGGVLDDS